VRSPFLRLLIADTTSMVGDWFAYVGIGVIAVSAHSKLALVVVLVAHTLPRVLLAPLAGALADRMDRRTLLVIGNLARGAAALAMVAAALAGAAWVVQACHLVRMALGAFTDAAVRAALPRLVEPARLGRANAILGVAWSATFLVGVAAGGAVTAIAGPAVAFAVDAASFAIAAIGFATLPRLGVAARGARLAVAWPRVRRAALAKVPVAIATGAAWIATSELAGGGAVRGGIAIALGAIHAARGIGGVLVPLVWPRRWRTSAAGLHASTALALAGVACVAFATTPIAVVCAAALWGAGVGANWLTATTRLQVIAPDAVLGRAVAYDLIAQAIAQCLGGVLAAMLGAGALVAGSGVVLGLVAWLAIARPSLAGTRVLALAWLAACVSVPADRHCATLRVAARPGEAGACDRALTNHTLAVPPVFDAHLRYLAVSDDDFYRPVLYTWTTQASIASLRASHQLLVATAKTGTFVSPFNRELATIAGGSGPGRPIAALLATHPALVHRRYAWPAPFATVMGVGDRSYGTALIRIELRPQAWIGRFDPTAPEPFAFVDAAGRRVATSAVLAAPERIAAIFHVRTGADVPVRFREYVVCNAAMVAGWSIATPAIRAELAAEARLLDELRDRFARVSSTALGAPAAPAWLHSPGALADTLALWHAALAFDNARYLPDRIDAVLAALVAYDGSGEPLSVRP